MLLVAINRFSDKTHWLTKKKKMDFITKINNFNNLCLNFKTDLVAKKNFSSYKESA